MKQIKHLKWRPALALALMILAFWFEWNWAWAVLFAVWVIPDIRSGTTHLLEPVSKKESPVLYWAIMSFWIIVIIYILLDETGLL